MHPEEMLIDLEVQARLQSRYPAIRKRARRENLRHLVAVMASLALGALYLHIFFPGA